MTARNEQNVLIIALLITAIFAWISVWQEEQLKTQLHALKAERDSLRSQLDSLTEILR